MWTSNKHNKIYAKKLLNISAYVNIANHNAMDPKQKRIINNVGALKYGMFVLDVVQDKSC